MGTSENFGISLKDGINNFKNWEFRHEDLTDKREFPEDYIDIIIEHACKDMMARTLQVQEGKGGEAFKKAIKCELKPQILDYFDDENEWYKEDNFKKWHQSQCDLVWDVINRHYTCDGNKVGYGKAQKIINMAFKYLYCFADEAQRSKYFKYCQIPLDSYILKGLFYIPGKNSKRYKKSLRRLINEEYQEGTLIYSNSKEDEEIGYVNIDGKLNLKYWDEIEGSGTLSWSNIKTYDDYSYVQKKVKDQIPQKFKNQPLVWENEVWNLAEKIIKGKESNKK